MTELTSRLVLSMDYLGFSQVKDSTKKHLRRKLGTELAGSIHILSDDKGRLLLYCLTMSVLAKATYSLKMELQHARAIKAGSGFSDALLGMHAFTGCDTVSAFAGRGKIGALKLLTSLTRPTKRPSVSLDVLGMCLMSFLRSCNRSHAICMCILPAQQRCEHPSSPTLLC